MSSDQIPAGHKFGKNGYCKLCHWQFEGELNEKIKAGQNAAQCNRWATAKYGFSFNRQTFYSHREHLKNPPKLSESGRALVALPEGGALEIKRTSNREFLETVRDIGYTKASVDPNSVTLEQALKAASILEQSKQKTTDIAVIFAQVVTGHTPDVVVEGTAREVASPSE